jgi:hypothetical protein
MNAEKRTQIAADEIRHVHRGFVRRSPNAIMIFCGYLRALLCVHLRSPH